MKIIESMRLDKWLWAARFFKTRALAQKSIELGRVKVNEQRVKNSKIIVKEDIVDLLLNNLPYRLKIKELSMYRGPATKAQLLYEEDEQIKKQREEQKELNKASRIIGNYPEGRPTKKDRREILKFKNQFNNNNN